MKTIICLVAIQTCLLRIHAEDVNGDFGVPFDKYNGGADFPFDKRNQLRRQLLTGTRRDSDIDGFKPGHTLLRPSEDWLRTALGFSKNTVGGSEVYGAAENIGREGGGGSIRNTVFRRSASEQPVKDLMNSLLSAVRRISDDVTVNMEPEIPKKPILRSVATNDAMDLPPNKKVMRSGLDHHHSDEDDSENSKSPAENQKNPGNPFTVFVKNYLQNALWNYKMDGDHMNLHVAAPIGGPPPLEPDATHVFFGRKWWYFNQDDYLPF